MQRACKRRKVKKKREEKNTFLREPLKVTDGVKRAGWRVGRGLAHILLLGQQGEVREEVQVEVEANG